MQVHGHGHLGDIALLNAEMLFQEIGNLALIISCFNEC